MNYYLKLLIITLFVIIPFEDQASHHSLVIQESYELESYYRECFFDYILGKKGDALKHLFLVRNLNAEVHATTGYPCILSVNSWKKVFSKTEKDYLEEQQQSGCFSDLLLRLPIQVTSDADIAKIKKILQDLG